MTLSRAHSQKGTHTVEDRKHVFDGLLAARSHHRKHPRNVNQEMISSFSLLDRVALFITERVGSFAFFLIIITWTVIWLGWNLLAPIGARFDPAPAFVLWLVISNGIQPMLMPLVMVGQNLQGRHSELRAGSDFRSKCQGRTRTRNRPAGLGITGPASCEA